MRALLLLLILSLGCANGGVSLFEYERSDGSGFSVLSTKQMVFGQSMAQGDCRPEHIEGESPVCDLAQGGSLSKESSTFLGGIVSAIGSLAAFFLRAAPVP